MQLKQACEELYQEMLSKVYAAPKLDLPPINRVAYCFKLCVEHWNKIKELVRSQLFRNEEEEIWFFKTMKPKITALIEYYTLVHHAILFTSTLKEEDVDVFWKKETDRIKKFYRQHWDFCEYYKTGRNHLDHIYFLKNDKSHLNNAYDTDTTLVSSHGHLVSTLLAYEMYETYILQQSRKLAH